MGLRAGIYKNIRGVIQNDPDLKDEILHVGTYNGQDQLESEEQAFPERPAILIQFGETRWRSLQYRVQQSEPFEVILHVFSDMVYHDEDLSIERWDRIERIGATLNGMGIPGDNTGYERDWESVLIRSADSFDESASRLVHDRITFTISVLDGSARAKYLGPSASNVKQKHTIKFK